MELEFQATRKDYQNFYKSYHLNRLKQDIIAAIIIPITIGYFSLAHSSGIIDFLENTFIAGALYLSILYLIPYLLSLWFYYLEIKKHPEYLEIKKIILLDEEGVMFSSGTKNDIWKWESFISLKVIRKNIVITVVSQKFILIPDSAFKSEAEFNNFLGTLQAKIMQYTGNVNNSTKEKPPYLVGLVGIIPIVGALLGILIILLGVFKYKDKWFTIIGAIGVLCTIGFYGTILTKQSDKNLHTELQIGTAKRQLNALVKDIEFYKIQKGEYPESLDDLESYSTTDILQNDGEHSYNFNYEVIGEKYKLFSSGVDKIPNTKDDLYPEIEVKDSTKIGFLKRE